MCGGQGLSVFLRKMEVVNRTYCSHIIPMEVLSLSQLVGCVNNSQVEVYLGLKSLSQVLKDYVVRRTLNIYLNIRFSKKCLL